MVKIWRRGVTKYLQKKGLVPKDIHAYMVATLGDDAPAVLTTQKWTAELRGEEILEVGPKSGSPATSTTEENIDRVHHIMMDDTRLTINQIASIISIFSPEKIYLIIADHFTAYVLFSLNNLRHLLAIPY
ncbi:uncharacterized protein LOC115210591 [Octopus sinensis]|uniref:Uncharacterized protein LOC115210591 n=1 Tax=Octopus sinensis TaxID=2607531 RepID=A0A6P7S9N6_9MOLL|nr:uncharacterized protein LOC115210591 [Octopus sinensis]